MLYGQRRLLEDQQRSQYTGNQVRYNVAGGAAIAELKTQSKPVTTLEEIAQVAAIPAYENIKMEPSFLKQLKRLEERVS